MTEFFGFTKLASNLFVLLFAELLDYNCLTFDSGSLCNSYEYETIFPFRRPLRVLVLSINWIGIFLVGLSDGAADRTISASFGAFEPIGIDGRDSVWTDEAGNADFD